MLPNFANGISPGIQRDNLTGPWGILIFHVPLREGGGEGGAFGGTKEKVYYSWFAYSKLN